jgi:hypothetical protein
MRVGEPHSRRGRGGPRSGKSIPERSHAVRKAEALDGPAPVASASGAVSRKRSLMTEETAVSHINTPGTPEAQTHEIELLDCGAASQMTKGFLLSFFFEASLPPFDRLLLL